jgi:hypothetical protein
MSRRISRIQWATGSCGAFSRIRISASIPLMLSVGTSVRLKNSGTPTMSFTRSS